MEENTISINKSTIPETVFGIRKYSYFSQLIIWIGLFSTFFFIAQILSGLLMVMIYGTAISELTSIIKGNGNLNGLRIAQMIATVVSFLVPAIIFGRLKDKSAIRYSQANVFFPLVGLLLIPIILYTFYPVLNLSFFVNKVSPWSNWMNGSQKEYNTLVQAFLNDKSLFVLILNLITVALLPAICEEWIFRGTLQKFLSEKINIHLAILLTSVVFSLIHFDFAAFLPRIILSILLGYIFYFSGSLWSSIFLHAVNNGAQVLLVYCNYSGIYKSDVENPEMPTVLQLVVYTLIFYVSICVFYYFCKQKKRLPL